MDQKGRSIFTIGHSNHAYSEFLSLLRSAGVTAVADVRSAPFSRYTSHFNRDELQERLRADGIAYVYLGRELGGRPEDRSLYSEGVADYEKMAATPEFKAGIKRVIEGSHRYKIALMCSEGHPLDCHRCLLVGRELASRMAVEHIMPDGRLVPNDCIEAQLLDESNRAEEDFFAPTTERLRMAYHHRALRVAYSEEQSMTPKKGAAE